MWCISTNRFYVIVTLLCSLLCPHKDKHHGLKLLCIKTNKFKVIHNCIHLVPFQWFAFAFEYKSNRLFLLLTGLETFSQVVYQDQTGFVRLYSNITFIR